MPKKSLKRHNRRTRHKKTTHRRNKSHKSNSHKRHKLNKYKSHKKPYKMRGGYGPGAGPVGYSWKAEPSTWPGAYASNGGNTNGMTFSNHYGYNSQGTGVGGLDPAISTRSDLANLHYQSGGGTFQDIVNLGELANYKFQDFFAKLNGSVNDPVDPSVTKQFIHTDNDTKIPIPINLNQVITENANKIANIE